MHVQAGRSPRKKAAVGGGAGRAAVPGVAEGLSATEQLHFHFSL